MRFHGILLLRDEGDIITQGLDHLLTWADSIYVMDTGSTDNTWDIIQDYARRDQRVVPFKRVPLVFSDNLRGYLFHQFRDRISAGDWVLRVDADEFYHITPRQFVAERMTPGETAAHLQWYYFRLTAQELADYESGRVDVAEDRKRAIADRRRYYKLSRYPEPRMFRYRPTMQWPERASFPYNAGVVARERLPIRHYPHRDPWQMERRFQLRAAMMRRKAHAGSHWKLDNWRKEVVDANGVAASSVGEKVGLSGEDQIDVGDLLYWQPGTPLPEVPLYNHVPGFRHRVARRVVHSLLLPYLDRKRPRFASDFQPELIPEEENNEIGRQSSGVS